jgi:hypothetical protein
MFSNLPVKQKIIAFIVFCVIFSATWGTGMFLIYRWIFLNEIIKNVGSVQATNLFLGGL